MRSELKEAIRRIHSDDYEKLLATQKKMKNGRRKRWVRSMTGWDLFTGTRASRVVAVLAWLIVLALIVLVVGAGIYYFNQYSRVRVNLGITQSLIDNEVKRRASLLPNLLVISAEYSAHEKALYKHISDMRTYLAEPRGALMAQGETPPQLSQLMSSLLAIAEQYPDLKATQSFEQLMKEWTETENRLTTARAQYIDTVRELNALRTTFPSNIYGMVFGYSTMEPPSYATPPGTEYAPYDFYTTYLTTRTVNEQANESGLPPGNGLSAPRAAPKTTAPDDAGRGTADRVGDTAAAPSKESANENQ